MKFSLSLLFLFSTQFSICQINKEIKRNGYQIFYTDNLRLDETGRNGSEFYLFTQKESLQDDFVENLNLMIQNLETLDIDLNKFVEITENQINQNGKLISSRRVVTEETEFHILIYESSFNGMNLKFLQYDFMKNKKAYFLTYSAKKDNFEKYLLEMERIINSFKILN